MLTLQWDQWDLSYKSTCKSDPEPPIALNGITSPALLIVIYVIIFYLSRAFNSSSLSFLLINASLFQFGRPCPMYQDISLKRIRTSIVSIFLDKAVRQTIESTCIINATNSTLWIKRLYLSNQFKNTKLPEYFINFHG